MPLGKPLPYNSNHKHHSRALRMGEIMKSRALKVTVIAIVAILGVLVCVIVGALSLLQVRTASLHDDWQSARQDAKLAVPVQVEGVEVITQDVSCG